MSGYIGAQPVPQTTQTRQSFTATANQTSFATLGYQVDYLSVYLNGVKLNSADFTATNGSDIVLGSGCAVNDILEMVAFSTFTVADQTFTGTTTVNTLAVTSTVDGRDVSVDGTKLDGIEASATADQTNAEIKTAVEAGSDIALGGNPTTTTQSAGNNTTRIATTAFTQAAVTALVDSSPDAMNTLNELAAALGDDASFSTTVTNSIATKLPLAGGTLTGALATTGLTVDNGSSGQSKITISEGGAGNRNLVLYSAASGTNAKIAVEGTTADLNFVVNNGSQTAMTIDGATGNVGIGIVPTKKLSVFGTGSGNATVLIEGEGGADPYINFLANNAQHWSLGIDDSDSDKFKLSEHSALGTNDYLVVDVTGNVGIGSSAPAYQLDLQGGATNNDRVRLLRGTDDANQFMTMGWNNISAHRNNVALASAMTSISFNQVGSDGTRTAMKIDSSGNLLVGTTSSSSNTAGIKLTSAGTATFVRSGVQPIYANRLTSDGDIAVFAKDGSTVGSIFSSGGIQMGMGDGDTGLLFADNIDAILPWSTSNTGRNGATDLGRSATRFKDLYLSGGVDFGGAVNSGGVVSSSNKLDDYEEGTWSPVLQAVSTNPTYAAHGAGIGGYYIKIGQSVTVWFDMNVNISNAGNGDSRISGLPFQPASGVAYGGYSTVQFRASTAFNISAGIPLTGWVYANDSRIYPEQNHANSVSGMAYVTGVKRITGMSTYISLA